MLPSISVLPPPRISGITYSPSAGTPTMIAPATTPGPAPEVPPAPPPGPGERQPPPPELAPGRRPEVGGRVVDGRVDPLERDVDRQHPQRQVRVDDADPDRGGRVEPAQVPARQVQRAGQPVDRPEVLQEVDPGVRADDEARPEGDDHRHQQEALGAR